MSELDGLIWVCEWVALAVVWNCCLAHSMYRKAVHRDSEAMLLTKFKLYLMIATIPAFVGSICLLAGVCFVVSP